MRRWLSVVLVCVTLLTLFPQMPPVRAEEIAPSSDSSEQTGALSADDAEVVPADDAAEVEPGTEPEPEPEPEVLTSSQAFVDILKSREGFRSTPYWDVSHYSIGYGSSVPSSMVDYYKKNPITEAEGEAMMREDLADFEEAILRFADKNNIKFTQNQFDAIVSFCYNCGDAWLSETNGFMNRAVKESWTGSDFVYAMCLWSRAGTEYILVNRRMYEANMYLNGIYQENYDYENGTFNYVFLEAGKGSVQYIICGYDKSDPKQVRYSVTKYPTGVDGKGNSFTYQFGGWYTAPENGKRVDILDGSVEKGAVLYALWMDPNGNLVFLPKGDACSNLEVTITGVDSYVNVRSGPGTYYPKVGQLSKSAKVSLTRVYDDGKTVWGQCSAGWFSLAYSNYEDVKDTLEAQFPQYGEVNANGVNVRSGAGTSNPVQYQLNKGDPVTIHAIDSANSMKWGKLDDGNWISMTYVTITGVKPEPELEPTIDKISDEVLEILKLRVGFTARPYQTYSGWYVGYRRKISESEVSYYQNNPLTMSQAEEFLLQDLTPLESAVAAFDQVKSLCFSQNQFDALVFYCFTAGTDWLEDSDDYMYRAVAENWTGSKFLYAIFLRSKLETGYGLTKSRAVQANIYLNNSYSLNYNFATGNFRYVFLEAGQGTVDNLTVGFDITDPTAVMSTVTDTPVGYTFAGWYTAPENGEKVEILNSDIPNASVLYALWKAPDGKLVFLEKGTPCVAIEVTVNSPDGDIYPYTGPGSFYAVGEKIEYASKLLVTDLYDDGMVLWGYCENGWINLAETDYESLEKSAPRVGWLTGDNVNVRSGPGTSNPIMYKLSKGTEVKIYQQVPLDEPEWGRLEDGNWISLSYVTFDSHGGSGTEPEPKPPDEDSADMDGNGGIDKDDAIYLLRHVVYPEQYPLSVNGDVDGNGKLDKDDAIYLLRHVVYPEQYPLKYGE